MAEAAGKLDNINVEEADPVLGRVTSDGEENAEEKATDCGGGNLTGILEGLTVTINNGKSGLQTAAKKKVKTARSSKKVKQRTEPLWAYNCFVQEEKEAIAPRVKLNMKVVNKKWRSLTPAEKVPYVERSGEDKASLGPHYREGRKWKNKKIKIAKKSVAKRKIVNRKVTETVESPGTSNEASLCSLIEELKSLDAELNNKSVLKLDKSCKLERIKVEAEFKMKEINDIDKDISKFQTKCKLLKRS